MEGRWRRGRRIYRQREAHEPGVYRANWGGAWFVQVRVRGHLEYHGSFREYRQAVAVARWVRRHRDVASGVAVEERQPVLRVEEPAQRGLCDETTLFR